ncbi:MAG: AI-2E family transporter [Bacillota bacterium]|nr:AI-2E family transporter [Bacillota bacterium]
MELIINFIKRESTRRILILLVLSFFLYLMRSMLNLFLLTFIFTYLMYRAQSFISSKISKVVRVKQKVVTVALYLALLLAVVIGLYLFLPSVIEEIRNVANQIYKYYKQPHNNALEKNILSLLKQFNINIKDINLTDYIHQTAGFMAKSAGNISKAGLDVFLALILSLFFLLEKTRITRFVHRFKESKISSFYTEIEYFGVKFANSFGKVIEAQIVIALINSILSTIALAVLGFDQVLGLGLMVFILGLIPVAGVFISLVPLSLIAFNTGGINMVLIVWIMVALLHSLEAYVLNPKLMSSKTELPVFFTFIILLIGEHFFKIWGLIIGIPIFMFMLDMIDVKSNEERKKHKILGSLNKKSK